MMTKLKLVLSILLLACVSLSTVSVFAADAEKTLPVSGLDSKGPKDSKDSKESKEADESNESTAPYTRKTESPVPFDFSAIEMLAIQEGGRKKPLHTYALEQLEQIVGRSAFASQPTLSWTVGEGSAKTTEKLDMMGMFMSIWLGGNHNWDNVPCILLRYMPLRERLGLSLDKEEKYFSFGQLSKNATFVALNKAVMKKMHEGGENDLDDMDKEVELLNTRIQLMTKLKNGMETMALVPHPSEETGTWISLADLIVSIENNAPGAYYSHENIEEMGTAFQKMREAYSDGKAVEFKEASLAFRTSLIKLSPAVYPSYDALNREIGYNKFRPFGRAWIFYFIAALLGLFTLKFRSNSLYYTTMGFFLAGLGLHVYGFVLRCLIAGRPPVSNMYESVLWVAFGVVLFGLIFELIYKARYYMLCGAVGGFCCLILMDQLPVVTGDSQLAGFAASIKPLPPVLRNNFWLTVHVLTITISYSAFLLAWVLGHVTLTSHLFAPQSKHTHHALHQFIYRVMQIGVLLLTIGTILGGVWAYYSWGRFWGWDPKETWAFITLLCYLFVLHGRFTGWWGNFGMTVGSVLCFLSVVMAWYGVNFVLGKLGNGGLHSYGEGAGGERIMLSLVILDLIYTAAAVTRYKLYQASNRLKSGEQNLSSTDPVDSVRAEFSE